MHSAMPGILHTTRVAVHSERATRATCVPEARNSQTMRAGFCGGFHTGASPNTHSTEHTHAHKRIKQRPRANPHATFPVFVFHIFNASYGVVQHDVMRCSFTRERARAFSARAEE